MKRHFRIPEARACGFEFPVEGSSNTAWHCLAVEGKWSGHWQGPFSINEAMMRQMVEYCAALRVATPVDYEHASVFGDRAPAAGWIEPGALEVRKRDSGALELWGKIDWTANAADSVRAREYRYLSPTIVFNTRDRKSGELTGASMHSVALTNKPFLEELPEVRLNSAGGVSLAHLFGDVAEEDPMNEAQFRAMCAALGLPETSTYDDAMVSLGRTAAASAFNASILQALSLQASASRADAVGAILKLQQDAQAGAQLEQLRAEMRVSKAAEVVSAGMREGKITAAGTPFHAICLEEAGADPERFAKKLAVMPKIVGLTLVQPATTADGAPPVPAGVDGLTADDVRAAKSLGLKPETLGKYVETPIITAKRS